MALRASIRVHLLRLVLAVAVPLVALQAWSLYTAAQAETRHAREQVFNFARITASDTARFLAQAQDVLNDLAARPAVRALDPKYCDPILQDFRALTPRFANVVTVALDGTVVCSAQPNPRAARANPDNFLKRMSGRDELTVGKAAPGVITGRWVVPIGWPLRDSRGEIAGAVVLPVDLLRFPELPNVAGLPANSVVGLISMDGILLARSKDAERYVGTTLANSVAIREKNGTAEVAGIDGNPRILGFTPVPGTDWIAFSSVPAREVYLGIRARTVTSALVALGVLCMALLLAVRWSREIAEPMTALASGSGGGAGNPAESALATGTVEIAEAAGRFKRLFDSRARARAGLRASEERVAGVIVSAMDAIITVNEDHEILIFNPAAEKMFGRAAADVVGKSMDILLPERYRAAHRRHIEGFGRTGITNRAMGKLGRIVGLRAGGEEFPIEASISQLGASPHKLYTVILRDVTERQRAEADLRDSLAQQRELLWRLQATEEAERRRINRELHDRIGQNLSMLILNLDLLRHQAPPDALRSVGERLDSAQELLVATTREVRDLMADLHPPALDDFGLLAALRTIGETLSARAGIPIVVSGAEASPRLPPAVEMGLFRVAEGALANAVNHAHATRIDVTLAAAERVTLTIADDGKGFDPGAGSGTRSWGLTIMRERAEAVGATLRIDSAPGAGTRVIVEAPVGKTQGPG